MIGRRLYLANFCFKATVDRVSQNNPVFSYQPLLQVLLNSMKPSLVQLIVSISMIHPIVASQIVGAHNLAQFV